MTYARQEGDTWRLVTVDRLTDRRGFVVSPRNPSMFLDRNGVVHISYYDPNYGWYDNQEGGLRYARSYVATYRLYLPLIVAGP